MVDIRQACTDGLTVLAGISGAITAWYWWSSSQVDVDPPAGPVPGQHFSVDGDYSATVTALRVVGKLNAKAAAWSAVSAALFTLAALT